MIWLWLVIAWILVSFAFVFGFALGRGWHDD